jgi:AraC-like DNA-binding protein
MQPYIRGGVLEDFPGTVETLGGDPAALLAEADVAPEVLTIPGIFLPYASYMRLLDCAARNLDTPHFGLEMARSGNAETLGTIGLIMQQARTVGEAWETLGRFYRIHDTYGSVKLRRAGGIAVVSYGIPRNDQPGARQVYDVAAGVVSNIMRQFCGLDFRALEIGFPYPKPADLKPYRQLPTDRMRFGATSLELYIESVILDKALPGGHSDELKLVLDDYFSAQGAAVSASQRVEDMIRRLLPTGECTLPIVAETLSMTVRTLQAKLDEEQNSFRRILENVRREIAVFHLRRGDMQLTQLAMVLGYSELSAFSRSFRNWYGVSPRRWAEQGDWRA